MKVLLRKMKNLTMKRLKMVLLCFVVVGSLTLGGCGGSDETYDDANVKNIVNNQEGSTKGDIEEAIEGNLVKDTLHNTEWVVYWYLCGSDLESNYGAATTDLLEMLEVTMPENVKIVIQTGGSTVWHNDFVRADVMGRYVYDNTGLTLVEEVPLANMGEAQTLSEFLAFGKENYPGNKTAVVLWNHGGGSVTGVAFDEIFDMDSLNLAELYQSFASIFGENSENPPIDVIGFDACLMATIDTAFVFSEIANYLVASQEIEPGNGWLYSGWIGGLASNPSMEGLELAKLICDTYLEGCIQEGTQDIITLSAIDLSKVSQLVLAYDEFGKEALGVAANNPGFFAHFAQVANTVENYGGNTREQGYTNMADLGSLAKKSSGLLPETSNLVIDAIEDAVVYKVNGKYRPESMGISSYYSYNGDVDDYIGYSSVTPSDSFRYLYAYGLTGELAEDGMEYLASMNYEALPEILTLESVNWEDKEVTVDENGNSTLTLGSEAMDVLSSITFELYYSDLESDILLSLGSDNNIVADWENGIFKDNFYGTWGSIDGALCYMEISYEGDGYNEYSVPIKLNGEEYNLMVVYDYATEAYYIEGARKPLNENGAADKNIRYLTEGDEITTVHFASSISDESGDFTPVDIDTIVVKQDISFQDIDLGDGYFFMMYVMEDSQGNIAYSKVVTFESVDGEIFTTVD